MVRIPAVALIEPFKHRPRLSVETFGDSGAEFLLENFIPSSLRIPYQTLTSDLLASIRQRFDQVKPAYQRVHGGCHVGNFVAG